ncbi:MAG: glycosyltransferase [bacterium]|nr:glycosyltransferase [bacterium]
MIDLLVALCLAAIALPFAAYPFLLWLRATLVPDPVVRGDVTPSVDLVIAAHDEAASIGARIENALALDYPADRRTIWIGSDGSTDDTVAIARRYEAEGVRVLDLPRGGKAAALRALVDASAEESGGEVLAFSDANSDWPADALRKLVAPFADERVGGVAGDQRYVEDAGDDALGERGYWRFDRALKRWQTRAGNAISSTGAIHAVRRRCFEAPPPDATDDFMISTGVIAAGERLVFAEDAIAWEPTAEPVGGEFRRKTRIITRGLRGVLYRRALLNPARTGLYAFELAVHKLLRRLTWIPLLGLVLLAPFAVGQGGPSALVTGGAALAVAGGAAGLALPGLRGIKLLSVAAYVVMVQAACAWATIATLSGRRVARWDPQRPANPAAESSS